MSLTYESEYIKQTENCTQGFMKILNEKKKKKNKGLWHNIRKRRKKGLRRLRPGEENYPKTLDIQNESDLKNFIYEVIMSGRWSK